jgi:transposase-like protein
MKVKTTSINRNKISWLLDQELDVKMQALQHHLDISRMLVNDVLEDEVRRYTGQRYTHDKPNQGRYSRWGYNRGSIKLGHQRVPVDVPRIYDNADQCNKSLESYSKLRQLQAIDDRVLKAVLLGLSTRDYEPIIKQMMDSFGISHSSVSKEFIEQSSQRLQAFENRSLIEYDFISLFIDGKYLAKEQVLIVLGVTIKGDKIPIGFIQTATENHRSIAQLLSSLIDRGLKYEAGLLVVIDGSKGIYKAVKKVFDQYAVIQRCHWHKRENVLSYLPEDKAHAYRRRMNKAYRQENYVDAKQALKLVLSDLKIDNMGACRSLEEGLEETLTLHRLGLYEDFGRSFATTNAIENLNAQIEKYLRKVKYWKNSSQRHRWIASALYEIEHKMRKVNNYKKLHEMRAQLKTEVNKKQKTLHNVA